VETYWASKDPGPEEKDLADLNSIKGHGPNIKMEDLSRKLKKKTQSAESVVRRLKATTKERRGCQKYQPTTLKTGVEDSGAEPHPRENEGGEESTYLNVKRRTRKENSLKI